MIDLSSANDPRASQASDHGVAPGSAALPLSSRAQRRRRCGALALAALSILAAGCADDEELEDENDFVVRNTRHAAASGGTPLLGDGPWLAYLLSEAGQGATGNDFNEDGDMLDSIAVRVNTNTRVREILDVAAEKLLIARRTLFMVVSEAADDTDWNGDMDSLDRVLLYQTPSSSTPVFLDTLDDDDAEVAVSVGGTITYTVAEAPTVDMETNLRQVTVASTGAAPGSPVMVMAPNDPTMDGVSFEITGSDSDILFLTSDETVDGDLNGDSDATDTDIFGVMDAGAASPEAICSCLPISPASQPTAVAVTGGGEWLIAFLVDEAAQGENLNDPTLFSGAWQPANCSGVADADQADHVLHWFQLTDLAMGTATVNTGLVGAATGTAYALRSRFVGVVSPEASEGGCDLNGDSDASDLIFRWVDASNPATPPLPVTSPARLLAVQTTIPGGSGGVVRLADTWILSVDEAADGRDHDGEPGVDRNVIAAHTASSSGQAWNFQHGTTSPRPVGASWMAEDPESAGQFFAAFSEAFGTIGGGDGDLNGDGDATDSVPTIGEVRSGNQLTFPGVATATSRTNPGITVEENIGFHRVSEADQGNTDLNGDGDTSDVVIQRFSLVNAFPRVLVATSSSVNGDSVFTGVGNAEFAAFMTEEFLEDADFNGDGDTNDFVVRYLRLPE